MFFKTFLLSQFLHFLLLISLKYSTASDFITYNDEYDEENYLYDEDTEDLDNEEISTTFLPVFTSSPTVYRVTEGHTARLECQVDRLGPMVLSWRRIINDTNTQYVATGKLIMVNDKRLSVLTSSSSSTLLITLVSRADVGQYICEVSSSPPVHMTHWIKLNVPPKVSILGKPESGQFRITENMELALVCQGSGEPAPTISWRREGQSLPDGSSLIAGDQLIFSQVGRDHAGTYVCTGHTDQARHRVRDMVEVVVQYRPLVTGWHSYTHDKQNISLEIVCSVTSNPQAKVDWSRLGDESKIETDLDLERYQVEYHEDRHNRDRVKHVLKINAPTTEDLNSVFVCNARNKVGQIRKTIPIKGDNDSSLETKELNVKTEAENVGNDKKDVNKTDENAKDDHKLLIAIAYNVKKLDSENENIVKALRQNNRYLHSILRHMKELLKKEQSSSHVGDV